MHTFSRIRLAGRVLLLCVPLLASCDGTLPLESTGSTSLTSVAAGVDVAAGAAYTCALQATGVVECWGANAAGQAPATRSATSGVFVSITAATHHSCALTSLAAVECWGENTDGEAPATRSAASGAFVAVDAGTDHTCALRNDGAAECWGNNFYGQAPALKTAATGTFTAVSAGAYWTCALRSDGVIECWGGNSIGAAPPTVTAASGSFTFLSAGEISNCALRSDGDAECWGTDTFGQAPDTKSGGAAFNAVSNNTSHTCALRTDGAIECWGFADFGAAPVLRVAGTGTYVKVSAGGMHTCAVRSDDVIECWGDNTWQQIEPHAIPGNVTATPASATSIDITWTYVYTEGTWFRVARRTWTGSAWSDWSNIAWLPSGSTSYTDPTAAEAELYQYRVRACFTEQNCSVAGRSGRVTTAVAPGAPASLTSVPDGPTAILVSWSNPAGETRFELQRRLRTGGTWGPWAGVTEPPADVTSVNDTDLAAGTYRYRIRACTYASCSDWGVGGVTILP